MFGRKGDARQRNRGVQKSRQGVDLNEPEWSDFRLVLALSRGGSVAGAARILGVDSSTVSRRLAAIEQALGACLVVRGGREFALTAEGREAVAAAQSMESVVTGAASSIRAAKTEIDGLVRVSVVPSMLRTLMPLQLIAAEKYPHLSIELTAARHIIDLTRGEADIALRMVRPKEVDLIARQAFEIGFGVFASKTYVARYGLPVKPEELSHHRLIQYDEHMLHLPWFAWIDDYASKGAPATRVDSTEMAVGLITTGGGIGVLPCYTGESYAELVHVFPDPIASAIGWIVYHETARNSARIRAVVDMLAAFLDTHRDELSGRRRG